MHPSFTKVQYLGTDIPELTRTQHAHVKRLMSFPSPTFSSCDIGEIQARPLSLLCDLEIAHSAFLHHSGHYLIYITGPYIKVGIKVTTQ
jgi:hypothetical protein